MNLLQLTAAVLLTWAVGPTAWAADQTLEADVVVYGDAAGGVFAAPQAARMGKETILMTDASCQPAI